uniref:Uncharacterized protein n=1 Tax=Steinernema glaseri TaxID=37863 RepID=A0A1I7ZK65_9BILA
MKGSLIHMKAPLIANYKVLFVQEHSTDDPKSLQTSIDFKKPLPFSGIRADSDPEDTREADRRDREPETKDGDVMFSDLERRLCGWVTGRRSKSGCCRKQIAEWPRNDGGRIIGRSPSSSAFYGKQVHGAKRVKTVLPAEEVTIIRCTIERGKWGDCDSEMTRYNYLIYFLPSTSNHLLFPSYFLLTIPTKRDLFSPEIAQSKSPSTAKASILSSCTASSPFTVS